MTAELVSKKRVNYMEAWVKTYSDGTKILQSYATDVVKRTPEGKYIRLWNGWSVTTNRHVYTAFDVSLKSLPFEDGTYEQTPQYRRGMRFYPWGYNHTASDRIMLKDNKGETTDDIEESVEHFVRAVEEGDINLITDKYSTCIDKELHERYKNNKKMIELFRAMRVCLEQKPRKDEISMLCLMYDYNFPTVYSYMKPNYDFTGELQWD